MGGELHDSKKVKISDQIKVETDVFSSLPDSLIHHILSLMDTIDAVRTCVLSKRWKNQWMYIHNLNFYYESKSINHRSPNRTLVFSDLIKNVVRRRKPIKMDILRFYCRDMMLWELMLGLLRYARAHGFEELDTDVALGLSSNRFKCQIQTLKILKMSCNYNVLTDLDGFETLTTLQLDAPYISGEEFFSKCLNLENLLLSRCLWPGNEILTISAPRLVNLKIINCCPSKKIKTSSPGLKIFNLTGTFPIQLSLDECTMLDKVDIHLSPPIEIEEDDGEREMYIMETVHMVQALCRLKSLKVFLEFSMGEFILYHDIADVETKVMEVDKETREEQLLFSLPIGQGYDANLVTMVSEMSEDKHSNLESEFYLDWLIGLCMMAGFLSQFPKDK